MRLIIPVLTTFFLSILVVYCAPDLGPSPGDDTYTQPTCIMYVINRHTQNGKECQGDTIAIGLASLSPMQIRCAEIDWECK